VGAIEAYVNVRARLMCRKTGPADIVLIGGSSVEYWGTSAADLLPMKSRNFGIGGSTAAQWVRLAHDLVLPCQPKAVFIFAGSNDLHMKKEPPEVAFDHLRRLFEQLSDMQIYYAGVYLTNLYRDFWEADRAYNQLVREYKQCCTNLEYIDIPSALTDESGKPLEGIFRKDGEHLNAHGYSIWREIIVNAIMTERD